MADIVEETLKKQAGTKPLLPSQQRRFREVQVPDGKWSAIWRKMKGTMAKPTVKSLI